MSALLSSSASRRYVAAFWLALPALIGLIVFQYWPIVESFRLSFTDYKVFTGDFVWAGAKHYLQATDDPLLITSLRTTFVYGLLTVPLQMALALSLAVFISRPGRGIGLVRTLILLPTVTSMVVASTVWGFMYHPTNGLINSFLQAIGLPPQGFLTSASQALASIAAISIWKEVGLSTLFYLAGLLTISREYYEAATVDGANSWQMFRHITVPLLRRTHIFVLVTSTIAAFKVFVPVQVLTDGGPSNATYVIVLYIFDLAFKYSRLGYAVALSVILALILLAISLLQMRITRDHDEE